MDAAALYQLLLQIWHLGDGDNPGHRAAPFELFQISVQNLNAPRIRIKHQYNRCPRGEGPKAQVCDFISYNIQHMNLSGFNQAHFRLEGLYNLLVILAFNIILDNAISHS